MHRYAAFGGILVCCAAGPSHAQDERTAAPIAESMIEVARERHRPPGVRRSCPVGGPGEIVVCAPDPDAYRVPSATERAIAVGVAVADGIPRAPDVFGLPPCEVVGCISIGSAPPPIYLIDLAAIPEPLSPDEAALVFRAEDVPAPNPAEASPAVAP